MDSSSGFSDSTEIPASSLSSCSASSSSSSASLHNKAEDLPPLEPLQHKSASESNGTPPCTASTAEALGADEQYDAPRVHVRIFGRRGRLLNSVRLHRNVYRIGSQENLVDLRLKSRGVRPLHAVLVVERDVVKLFPFEDSPVSIANSNNERVPVEGVTKVADGQTFYVEGVRFTVNEIRPGEACALPGAHPLAESDFGQRKRRRSSAEGTGSSDALCGGRKRQRCGVDV